MFNKNMMNDTQEMKEAIEKEKEEIAKKKKITQEEYERIMTKEDD